ncbi:unnamed protein product [Ostreobium quekettii]|uniref:TFIIS N-terminal domain-containing protein n=1 Tax=Ostreobium quekettii TaxID=121088 RepID=A0A8S1J112_9CHLO|nr:unnamed protein product [Ostreobium quekettii]|eukprot:evm.model.scf_435.5 EVM.evm.TU.scf_435.5   scf_435:28483-30743(-)
MDENFEDEDIDAGPSDRRAIQSVLDDDEDEEDEDPRPRGAPGGAAIDDEDEDSPPLATEATIDDAGGDSQPRGAQAAIDNYDEDSPLRGAQGEAGIHNDRQAGNGSAGGGGSEDGFDDLFEDGEEMEGQDGGVGEAGEYGETSAEEDEGEEPGEGEGVAGGSDEAEEVDEEFEKMFKPKGRRSRGRMGDTEIKAVVTRLLDKMDAAAVDDYELLNEGEPALNKLKLLEEVEAAVLQRDLQSALLDGGVLGSLKAWLEPFNGTLPNERIRSSVLGMLHKLPIDTADHFRREQLKRSRIGSRVMFYSKVKEESVQNRRIARELVQAWSRPISQETRNEEEEERQRAEQLQNRKRQLEAEREEELRAKIRRASQPGRQFMARIPERNRMDYVIQPQSKISTEATKSQPKKESAVVRHLQRIKRKKIARSLQAMKPSIEGKGLL